MATETEAQQLLDEINEIVRDFGYAGVELIKISVGTGTATITIKD